jgi:MSHA biogenesis protein MshL
MEAIDEIFEESVNSNLEMAAVPDNISRALIPSLSLGSDQVPDFEEDHQRFDISVNNVAADQFFLSLVDGTDYNMVIHPEVVGTITLNLRDVTIPDVLEAVRDVYGYEFVNTAYGFQVLPGRLRARIYQINYLNVERSGSSRTFVSSGSLTGTGGGNSRNGLETTEADSGSTAERNSLLGTQISTRQPESVFWEELHSSIQAIVGTSEGRSVVVNPQSGVVVVRALPNELREVESFLTATQLVVQRQVILEAKIIEVALDDSFQSGINWAGLLTINGNKTITIGNTGGGTVLVNEGGVSDIAGNTGILDPANLSQIEGTEASAFGGVFSAALNLGDFTSFIELLKTQGSVRVLSSPRVATINNQKAVIKVGTDEFFVTEVATTTSTGVGGSLTTPSVTLTPFFSGIALDVTPQISQDDFVTLHVHPSVSDVVDQQKTVTIGNSTQQIPLALSSIRESDSIVRARSGQVIVIGGLMKDSSTNRNAATPGAGDIPVVGNLFKQKNNASVKSELVILLKPIVVNDTQQWTDAINEYSQNIDNLR